jgi:hypothetical protein
MSDWTNIPDATFDPDKPILGSTHLAIVKNFNALAAGDAGAPRVTDAALSTTVTSAGADWVAARTAILAVGAVGSYAMMFLNDSFAGQQNPGDTLAGSSLRFSDAAGLNRSTTVPSGTWRCMGSCLSSSDTAAERVTLWLRIS